MVTRKSHPKSRNGCQLCKKRRVKCDEQRPKCGSCVARKTYCSYQLADRSIEISDRNEVVTKSAAQPNEAEYDHVGVYSKRCIELAAMHQWSISTYKTLCSGPGEEQLWRCDAVKAGLRHEFLLNGILALSALEISLACKTSVDRSKAFLQAALGYYVDASSAFREELLDINQHNFLAVFLFSLLALVINLALPRCEPQERVEGLMLNHVLRTFDLLHGTCDLTETCLEWLLASPINIPPELAKAPVWYLDSKTTMAVARLRAVNKHLSRIVARSQGVTIDPQAAETSFETAIVHLELCFAREAEGSIKHFYFAWPEFCTKQFSAAMMDSHPMALFLLMHWGVLLSKAESETWWISRSGTDLVAELSGILRSQYLEILEWQDAISWARREAGLDIV